MDITILLRTPLISLIIILLFNTLSYATVNVVRFPSGTPVTVCDPADFGGTCTGGGGGGSPGGLNTDVQYNNSSAFGGSSSFTWNDSTKLMTVSGEIYSSDSNGDVFHGSDGNYGVTGQGGSGGQAGGRFIDTTGDYSAFLGVNGGPAISASDSNGDEFQASTGIQGFYSIDSASDVFNGPNNTESASGGGGDGDTQWALGVSGAEAIMWTDTQEGCTGSNASQALQCTSPSSKTASLGDNENGAAFSAYDTVDAVLLATGTYGGSFISGSNEVTALLAYYGNGSTTGIAGEFKDNNSSDDVKLADGTYAVNVVTGNSQLNKIINTRITRRISSTSSSATPSINIDTTDLFEITALATGVTSFTTNLTGSPNDGDLLEVRILDNGTPQSLSWGSAFASTTVALPTTTVTSTTIRILLEYNTISSKWECIGVT